LNFVFAETNLNTRLGTKPKDQRPKTKDQIKNQKSKIS